MPQPRLPRIALQIVLLLTYLLVLLLAGTPPAHALAAQGTTRPVAALEPGNSSENRPRAPIQDLRDPEREIRRSCGRGSAPRPP